MWATTIVSNKANTSKFHDAPIESISVKMYMPLFMHIGSPHKKLTKHIEKTTIYLSSLKLGKLSIMLVAIVST